MPLKRIRRGAKDNLSGSLIQSEAELVNADPDYLRDSVRRALLSLSFIERTNACRRVLDGLSNAGFGVRECLLKLGASARTTEELTAPEIAALIRYVRLIQPNALLAVAPLLHEVFVSPETVRSPERAA
jgi:hypothetical protein